MAHREPSSPIPVPTNLRYGIAVLSVAIAIGLGFFVLRHFEAILTPFLFAVAATVWYAGTGPGVLAIVLSVLSLNYFFLRPFFSFSTISYADLVYLTFCIFCALAVGWAHHSFGGEVEASNTPAMHRINPHAATDFRA